MQYLLTLCTPVLIHLFRVVSYKDLTEVVLTRLNCYSSSSNYVNENTGFVVFNCFVINNVYNLNWG